MKNQVLITVVIPAYNCENYFKETLDCLIHQTFSNYEIICVNDGSTDKTEQILCEYTQKDRRIRVVQQDNKGAATSRDIGMSMASGKYLLFLDSDDLFEPDLMELVYEAGERTQADIVLFDGDRYYQKGVQKDNATFLNLNESVPEVFSRDDIPEEIFNITNPAAWTKLFRKEFIKKHQLEFQNLSNANDFYFSMMALALAQRITSIDKKLVHYRVQTGTSIQDKKGRDPYCFIEAIHALYKGLCDLGCYEQVRKSFIKRSLSTVAYNLDSNENRVQKEILKKLSGDALFMQEIIGNALLDQEGIRQKALILNGKINGVLLSDRLNKKEEPYHVVKRAEENNYIVTVIIPCFNSAKYLRPCIESVLNQTLDKIEIVCIDDGSFDDTFSILMDYAKKKSNMTIIQQANSGLSISRNHGLEVARGEYIQLLDSDDLLTCEALQKVVGCMSEWNADIVFFEAETFIEDDYAGDTRYVPTYGRINEYKGIYSGKELMIQLLTNKEYFVSACLYMFRKSHISKNKLYFEKNLIYEDNVFTTLSLYLAKRACCIPEKLYKRRIRNESITTTKPTALNAYCYYKAYLLLTQKICSNALDERILGFICHLKEAARWIYLKVQEENRADFTYVEDEPFSALFYCFTRVLELDLNIIEQKNKEILELKERVKAIEGSLSYRTGNAIAKPWRLIKNRILTDKENEE